MLIKLNQFLFSLKYSQNTQHYNRFNQLIFYFFIANFYSQIVFAAKNVSIIHMEVISGEPAYIPCDISTAEEDEVLLVLWFRDNIETPIYSIDGRKRGFNYAERWSDEKVFSNRAYFMAEKTPAELGIDHIRESDEAVYRCRVDFKIAQTRNSKVNLTIIVPPEKILITNEFGMELKSVVGPLLENQSFVLKCDVFGGKPKPTVKWLRNNVTVNSKSELLILRQKVLDFYYIRNSLVITNLSRQDLHTELTCEAKNNPRTQTLKAVLYIDMNFAPIDVKIISERKPLTANRKYDLLCQSSGSRPAAVITWWKNGYRIENSQDSVFQDGNTTTSTLSFIPSKSDAGKYLICRSENQLVSSFRYLEDKWKLEIHYIPEVEISLGISLDSNEIREGTDVYFDCIINAYPNAYKVEWKHNGRMLNHNIAQGIIMTNQSLVLQGISRKSAGNYSCVGYNNEGDGESANFYLNVLYRPFCKSNQIKVYGIAKHENASIKCHVDSNPKVLSYKWVFNNSAEIDIRSRNNSKFGTLSSIMYSPKSEIDYGTLLCLATNRIGEQLSPCVYHIIAASEPDHVHNCTLSNISMTSLSIECTAGFNGGLTQSFFLEIYEVHDPLIKINLSSSVPLFIVNDLNPGAIYQLTLFSYNRKGVSEPFLIQASTLSLPEKHLIVENDKSKLSQKFASMINVIIGAITAVVIVFLLLLIVLRLQCSRKRTRRKAIIDEISLNCDHQISSFSTANSTNKSDLSSSSKHESYLDCVDSDDKNPDIIPQPLETTSFADDISLMQKRQIISTIDLNIDQNYIGSINRNIPICFQYHSSNCKLNNVRFLSLFL